MRSKLLNLVCGSTNLRADWDLAGAAPMPLEAPVTTAVS
jgi:hypothetical protein